MADDTNTVETNNTLLTQAALTLVSSQLSSRLLACDELLFMGQQYDNSSDRKRYVGLNILYGKFSQQVFASSMFKDLGQKYADAMSIQNGIVFYDNVSSHYMPLQDNEYVTNQFVRIEFTDNVLTQYAIDQRIQGNAGDILRCLYTHDQSDRAYGQGDDFRMLELPDQADRTSFLRARPHDVLFTRIQRDVIPDAITRHNESDGAHDNIFSQYRKESEQDQQHENLKRQLRQYADSLFGKNDWLTQADLETSVAGLKAHILGADSHYQIFANYTKLVDFNEFKKMMINGHKPQNYGQDTGQGNHNWLAKKKQPEIDFNIYLNRNTEGLNQAAAYGYFQYVPKSGGNALYKNTAVCRSNVLQVLFQADSSGKFTFKRGDFQISLFDGARGDVKFNAVPLKSTYADGLRQDDSSDSVPNTKWIRNLVLNQSKHIVNKDTANAGASVTHRLLSLKNGDSGLGTTYYRDDVGFGGGRLFAPEMKTDKMYFKTVGTDYIDKDRYTGDSDRADKVKISNQASSGDQHYVPFTKEQQDGKHCDLGKSSSFYYVPKTDTVHAKYFDGTATRAKWADLAENYLADAAYPAGTLVKFGGEKQVTAATGCANGVVSQNPAVLMNSQMPDSLPVALAGRVRVRIAGPVGKFDYVAVSEIPGVGRSQGQSYYPNTIARALEEDLSEGQKLVLCVVQMHI